jgi:hypothetical protein
MKTLNLFSTIAGMFGLYLMPVLADDEAKLNEQLDFNHDGRLEQVEILAGYLNQAYPGMFDLAAIQKLAKSRPITLADLGLKTEDGELKATGPWDLHAALNNYTFFISNHPGRDTFLFSEFNPSTDFGLKPKPPGSISTPGGAGPGDEGGVAATPVPTQPKYSKVTPFPKVTLARSTSDILAGVSGKTQPAYLSWIKNDRNGSNQLLVQGILAADFGMQSDSLEDPVNIGNFGLFQYDLLPSISFDKATDQTDAATDVDSLVFRAGASSQWGLNPKDGKPAPEIGATVSGDVAYATDFEFREEIPTVEFDVLPIYNEMSFGKLQDVPYAPFPLQVQTLLDLHIEGGDVVDRGSNTKLQDNTGYLRGGPKLGLTFVPKGDEVSHLGPLSFKPDDLSFNVSYLYYARALGIEGNAHLLQASGTWAIGGSPNTSLVITYQNGITALQLQSAHYLSVGLGLKF